MFGKNNKLAPTQQNIQCNTDRQKLELRLIFKQYYQGRREDLRGPGANNNDGPLSGRIWVARGPLIRLQTIKIGFLWPTES